MSYLDFKEMPAPVGRKTKIFAVLNTLAKIPLGTVKFHSVWRKYIFWPEKDCGFDDGCMIEIVEFVREQTSKWRESL